MGTAIVLGYITAGVAVGICAGRRFFLEGQQRYPGMEARYWTEDVLFSAIPGLACGLFWPAALVALAGQSVLSYYHPDNKEARRGRNRQAEASASDPDSGEVASNHASNCAVDIPLDPSAFYRSLNALTSGYASGGVVPSLAQPEPEVETVESDVPILAHRIAKLTFNGTDRMFQPLNHGSPFGVDATARCEKDNGWGGSGFTYQAIRSAHGLGMSSPTKPHAGVPALHCTCGFYALPSDITPWDEGAHYVTLMVELSGTVIEHEEGYRAEHQRVVECQIPACRYCRAKSDVVMVEAGAMVSAACTAHLPAVHEPGTVVVGIDDLRATLQVPVTCLGREREVSA